MIQDPDQFFGRRREVSRILSRMGTERPQSVSVVGDRRIGKSSLLHYLTWPQVQLQHLRDPSALVVVSLDFQQLRVVSLEAFFSLLFRQIQAVKEDLGDPGRPGYDAFQTLLETLGKEGKKLIFLFDEFDAITSNSAFDGEFFSYLRSVANNYAVAYVTSSKTELQRLCHSSEIADSPFFNIFTNLYLKPFERDEAVELITLPSEKHGIPLDAFVEEIMDLAGLCPFYLQIACSVYFDWMEENPFKPLNNQVIETRFLEEAGSHFEYFWEHAGSQSREVLTGVTEGVQPGPEEVHICRRLVREGYLVEKGKELRIFSRVFADYIRSVEHLSRGSKSPQSSKISQSSRQLLPGLKVNQYEVLLKLGEGGMGVVYQAHDTALDRKVALKVIKPELLQQETARKRFLQEARSAAALNHPAICAIYELFDYGNQVLLVMEWLDGETLREAVEEEGPLEWRKLVQWLIEACDGLEVAHQRLMVHRDIKSSNLMITSENHLKILDFGLAKHWGTENGSTQLTVEGTLVGTLGYMSPEQARGEPVDQRSDLFSLGVVFFEGLTGKLPFQRKSTTATLYATVNEPVPDLGLYQIEDADRLDPLIRKLLEKPPDDRYQSAGELKKDLKQLLKKGRAFLPWIK
ncbi:MAG: protein kinase [Acidobacteria bacterium]|nr:protein kinase [Acidobacteriota bacterium]